MSNNQEEKVVNEKVDVEVLDDMTARDVYDKVYGKDVVDRGLERQKDMLKRMKEETDVEIPAIGFVNKGLDVDTNARLSFFANEKVYPNDWTNSTLNLLESWHTACKKASLKHADAARVCRKKHRQLAIPTLFVGAIGTAISFFSAGEVCDPDDDGSENLKIAVAVFTTSIAVLGGIGQLYSFNQKMTENIGASGSFANLGRRIETQIFLPNHLRAPAEVTLTDVGSSFEHLVNTSPLL